MSSASVALIHFFMQSKLNVWEPFVMAGLCLADGVAPPSRGSDAARAASRWRRSPRWPRCRPERPALGEAAVGTGSRPARRCPLVLAANLSADAGIRPELGRLRLAAALTLAAAERTAAVAAAARRLKPA